MYDYIEGKIVNVYSNSIVIDNHGIGYLIYTANPYAFHENEIYKIYIIRGCRFDGGL